MRKQLLFVGMVILLIVSLLFFWELVLPLLNPANGRLSIQTPGNKAKVIIDSKEVGETPFYSDHLRIGDHKIELKSADKQSFRFSTNTTLNSTTLSILDIDLSSSQTFSAGENLYFKEGLSGLSLITRPEGTTLIIDGKSIGKSPFNQSLSSGVHTIKVEKKGYLTREVPINIEQGYKLSALIYLSANPFENLAKIDNSSKASFFQVTNKYVDLSKSYADWANGIVSTEKNFDSLATRFDLLIDPTGKSYILNETQWKNKKATRAVINVGYLTKKQSDKVTSKAQVELDKIKAEFN